MSGNLPPNAIVPTLSLETINPDLYRSKTLWCPTGARGVFGGQVIGQALVAATSTVGEDGKGWSLHSQHCYFILPADPNIPILYAVQRLRDGRSYATRSIVASQNAIPIFHLTCSFARPSPTAQPAYQDPLPDLRFLFPLTAESRATHAEVSGNFRLPGPDDCELEEERWQKILTAQDQPVRSGGKQRTPLSAKARVQLQAYMTERAESPIAIKEVYPLKSATMMTGVEFPTSDPETDNGTARPEQVAGVRARNRRMLWMKLRDGAGLAEHGAGFEKCILAYLSDFQFVGTAAQSVGLSHNSNPRLAMMASLDHTVFFYSDSFTTAEWLLHVVDSPRTGGGRGVVTGRFYTQSGELIAVCVQEGVVRAAPRKEDGPGAKGKDAAKL